MSYQANGRVVAPKRARVRPPKTWCQYIFDIAYDLITCALAAVDVVSDVIIAYQFYQQGLMVFFYCSLFFLFIAQVCYSLLFVLTFCDRWSTESQAAVFVVVFPFAQIVPLLVWLSTLEIFWVDQALSLFGFKLATGMSNNINWDDDEDPLREWLLQTARSHLGFIVETVVESVPQAILQMVAIVVSGHASTINIFSLIISLISVASKGLMLSYSVYFRTFIWNILCFCFDVFNIFACIAYLFCNTPGYELYDVPFFSHQFHYWSSLLMWKELLLIGSIVIFAFTALLTSLAHAPSWRCPPCREMFGLSCIGILMVLLFFPFLIVAEAFTFTIVPMIIYANMTYTTQNAVFFRDLTHWIFGATTRDGERARVRATNFYFARISLWSYQQQLRNLGLWRNAGGIRGIQWRPDYRIYNLLHPKKLKLTHVSSGSGGGGGGGTRVLRITHPWTESELRAAQSVKSSVSIGPVRSSADIWRDLRNCRSSCRCGCRCSDCNCKNFTSILMGISFGLGVLPIFFIGKVFNLIFPLLSWYSTPTIIVDPALALVSDVTAAVTGDVTTLMNGTQPMHSWVLDGGVAVGVGVLQRTLFGITAALLICIIVGIPSILRFLYLHYHIIHSGQVTKKHNPLKQIQAEHDHAYLPTLVYHHLVGDAIEALDHMDTPSLSSTGRSFFSRLLSSSSSSDARPPQILPASLAAIVASYCSSAPDDTPFPTIGEEEPYFEAPLTWPKADRDALAEENARQKGLGDSLSSTSSSSTNSSSSSSTDITDNYDGRADKIQPKIYTKQPVTIRNAVVTPVTDNNKKK